MSSWGQAVDIEGVLHTIVHEEFIQEDKEEKQEEKEGGRKQRAILIEFWLACRGKEAVPHSPVRVNVPAKVTRFSQGRRGRRRKKVKRTAYACKLTAAAG